MRDLSEATWRRRPSARSSRSLLEHLGRSARSDDPLSGIGGHPASELGDAVEVPLQIPMVDRFVMSDAVPEEVDPLDPIINGLANGSRIAVSRMTRERVGQRRHPKRGQIRLRAEEPPDIGTSEVRVLCEGPGTVPASADGRGFALFAPWSPQANSVGVPPNSVLASVDSIEVVVGHNAGSTMSTPPSEVVLPGGGSARLVAGPGPP